MKIALLGHFALIAVLAINTSPAHGQSRGCSDFKNIALVSISLTRQASPEDRERYTCADFQMFDDQLDDMKRISPFQLSPLILVAARPPMPGEGSFGVEYGNIAVAYNPRDPKDVENVKRIFAHEVGHYILQSHLNKVFPVLDEMARVRKNSNKMLPFIGMIAKMMDADPTCRTEGSACRIRISAMYDSLPDEVRNSEKRLREFLQNNAAELIRVTKPDGAFHELYGDVVAAIYFNDPDVNMDRLSGKRSADRSFIQPLTDFKATEEPHGAFAPMRRDLWKQWILPRMQNRKDLLRKLAEAFSAEIKIQANEGKVDAATSMARLRKRLGLLGGADRNDPGISSFGR